MIPLEVAVVDLLEEVEVKCLTNLVRMDVVYHHDSQNVYVLHLGIHLFRGTMILHRIKKSFNKIERVFNTIPIY